MIAALLWTIIAATITVFIGMVVLESLKRRDFDPVGSLAKVFSPSPAIAAEVAS